MGEWDATSYEGKGTILRVVREEAARMFALAEQPAAWDAPTACENWQVKDIIGHLVDTTEGYFRAFDIARRGAAAADAFGLIAMHERAGESAQSFHHVSQQELMARVRDDLDKMMGILEPLTAEEWGGLMVTHSFMGPVPCVHPGRRRGVCGGAAPGARGGAPGGRPRPPGGPPPPPPPFFFFLGE